MAATYDSEKLFLPRNRVRSELRDTNTTHARFQDGELDEWLKRTAVRHFLWFDFNTDTASVTAAEIQVKENLGGTALELVLTRTATPSEDPDTFDLSDTRYDTVGELVLAINALAKGWLVGLHAEATPHWLFESPDNTVDRMHIDALNGFASRDLMLVPALTDVYGVQRVLSLNLPQKVVAYANERHQRGAQNFKAYKEKDVSWTMGSADGGSEQGGGGDSPSMEGAEVFAVPLG